MRAKEFAEMCYEEKEIQLKEYMNGNESLVAKLKNELALSNKQEKILYELLDTVLTDTYITLLYALDGTASLGNGKQENFKLYGEDGNLIFNSGELEMAVYEIFCLFLIIFSMNINSLTVLNQKRRQCTVYSIIIVHSYGK